MTVLLLIRHAETATAGRVLTGQAEGVPLTARGREQASRLAERLRRVPLAAVYSSPLERCRETAAPLVDGRRLEVRPLPGVLEVEYGRWTGRTIRQLARTALWRRVQTFPSRTRFPGGESPAEVQQRSVDALEDVVGRHRGRFVAVVTHAEIVRLVLAHYAGIHLDLYQRLVVSPASVTALALGDGPPRVLRVNDTGTLEDLVPRPPTAARNQRREAGLR